ncbi:MAG TPA: Mbeg1-like protein, partial [Treponemataceae bacterium]|nr:Mbeg1-like protein [Treponemataceae bacterium]
HIDSIVTDNFKTKKTLQEIAVKYAEKNPEGDSFTRENCLINPLTPSLLQAAGKSKRFGSIKIQDFIHIFNNEYHQQFTAFTAYLNNDTLCIVFRGTNETIAGWKEDFDMCVLNPIPSQKDALSYLENIAKKTRKKIQLMGHSKGGNLAIYASAFCSRKTSKQITTVYNYDGPGFLPEVTKKKCFKHNASRVQTFVPQSSLVGLLLDHPDDYTIVQSTEKTGITQHDPFSWVLEGPHFKTVDSLTKDALFLQKTIASWLDNLTITEREHFLSVLYTIIDQTGVCSLNDFGKNWAKHSGVVLNSLRTVNRETRKIVWNIMQLFFQAVRSNIPQTNALQNFISQFIH